MLVPVAVGTADGLAMVVEDRPGPLQAYIMAPVPPLATEVRFTVPPRQTGPLLLSVAAGTAGTASTVTVVVDTVPELHPEPVLLTVRE